jgi:hypothetical protein
MGWLDRLLRRDEGESQADTSATPAPGQVIDLDVYDGREWRSLSLEMTAARPSDALNDDPPAELEEILLVVPPPEPRGDPTRRLHRPPHPIWVRIGEWSIVGSLHLPPGSAGSAYLLRRNHQFFVLTDAILSRPVPDGREERRIPVLLVNLRHVSSLRDSPEPEVAASAGLPRV